VVAACLLLLVVPRLVLLLARPLVQRQEQQQEQQHALQQAQAQAQAQAGCC
jgi:hypothetical protein